ncbi:hypothetical protein ZWY2020_018318 [Hordeum vulgare]|nr:hypothetical protein ZWY2020_018318 [Hordeum vulgare]
MAARPSGDIKSLPRLTPRPPPQGRPLVLEPHNNRLGDPVDAVANGFAVGDLEGRLKDAAEAAAHAPYNGASGYTCGAPSWASRGEQLPELGS